MRWMRRLVVALGATALGASAMVSAAAAAPPSPEVRAIVVLAPGRAPAGAAPALAAAHGGRVTQLFDHVLGGFEFAGPSAALDGLAHAPGVRAVVPNGTFHLDDVAGLGFFRIGADVSVNAPPNGYRGAGVRIGVIDTGVDTTHPDLTPNLDLANAYNCVTPGASVADDVDHGTHVSGIAAAAFNSNGFGIVGVAPSATIVPIKSFDSTGTATTAQLVCGFNRLAALTQSSPKPMVVNMSWVDTGTDSQCDDGITTDVLHEAMCDLVSAGQAKGVSVIPVAGAGNDSVDAVNTVPAAFHDVIAVSGLADSDGKPGGLAGCPFVSEELNYECDDTLASFSNWGSVIDVAAPAVHIYSDVPGGGLDYKSGTSMAAPHVTGVVAAVLGANPSLDLAGVLGVLRSTGECPNGTVAGSDQSCTGQGQWRQTANRTFLDPLGTKADPDGIPEPLVNAGRATAAAGGAVTDTAPTVAITSPAAGASVSGTVTVSGTSGDDHGVTGVQVYAGTTLVGSATPGTGGAWSVSWATTGTPNGAVTLTAKATDTVGHVTTSAGVGVTVANATSSTVMHVASLTGSAVKGSKWTAGATVKMVDANGVAVSGATVGITAKYANRSSGLSCVTTTAGTCSVSVKVSAPSVTFTVSSATKSGWTYNAGANVTTTVTVLKP